MPGDFNWQQLAIAGVVLAEGRPKQDTSELNESWFVSHRLMIDRWMSLKTKMASTHTHDPAALSVAIRELLDLVQSNDGASHRF